MSRRALEPDDGAGTVIFRCNYEEISALKHGARALLDGGEGDRHAVAAPPAAHAEVTALLPRLEGDLSINTLGELRTLQLAVDAIVTLLRVEMEAAVAATHPADEQAVAAYFEFAHGFAVLTRLREMGGEMEALIELMTGGTASTDEIRDFVFPD